MGSHILIPAVGPLGRGDQDCINFGIGKKPVRSQWCHILVKICSRFFEQKILASLVVHSAFGKTVHVPAHEKEKILIKNDFHAHVPRAEGGCWGLDLVYAR